MLGRVRVGPVGARIGGVLGVRGGILGSWETEGAGRKVVLHLPGGVCFFVVFCFASTLLGYDWSLMWCKFKMYNVVI